jgi:acyl-coenzyme A thioesterase PaaI-like protein
MAELGVHECFGCGARNPQGLHIKSYWADDDAATSICTWQPQAHFAGWFGVLNGGIIATLMDCHCCCTAIAAAHRTERQTSASAPVIPYATGSLQVTYLRPVSIAEPVRLVARIAERSERKTMLSCSLVQRDEECARAEAVMVRARVVAHVSN